MESSLKLNKKQYHVTRPVFNFESDPNTISYASKDSNSPHTNSSIHTIKSKLALLFFRWIQYDKSSYQILLIGVIDPHLMVKFIEINSQYSEDSKINVIRYIIKKLNITIIDFFLLEQLNRLHFIMQC